MGFINAIAFEEITDKIAAQAQELAGAVESANEAGTNGPVYTNISVLEDRDVETNALLLAAQRFDAAITRTKLFRAMTKWSSMIDALTRALSTAGVADSIDEYLTARRGVVRASPWFSIVYQALKNVHLSALNVFPEEPTAGTPVELATVDIVSLDGATGSAPDGLTGVTGVEGIDGDMWPAATIEVTFNPLYTVGGKARLGVGGTSKFQEFSASDPTAYNAGAGFLYVETISDPSEGAMEGVDEDLVLQLGLKNEAGSTVTKYVTVPAHSGIGTQVYIQGGRYLQINSIEHVFGGDLDLQLKVYAAVERTISL